VSTPYDTTSADGARLAPPPLLLAIAQAADLLVEAATFALLREALEPESRNHERATDELAKFLTLSRVAIADALSYLEEE
jgi:response regulator of citrate/malate metabolism